MTVVKVEGMKCQHCSKSVMGVLESFASLKDCKVNLEQGEISFSGEVDMEVLKKAIEEKGFKCIN